MSFLLRLCLGLMVLVPSLAHAAALENPGNGLPYSGVGVISGWKCETSGPLTAHIYDEDMMLAWPDPIPLVYGTERTDVRDNGQCLDNDHDNVGFVAIWNWGNLGSDGTYTVVVEEEGMELAQSTVKVTMVGPESQPQFLTGASGECRVSDFPTPGESTLFEWNQNTQHLEAVMRDPSTDLDTVPSLAHAAALENPGNGLPYSGVGVISGWKCETSGPLTAHIYDEDMMLAWPDPIPLVYGTERTDVRDNGQCLDNDHDNVGFVAIWNWGNLGSDGTYTVVVEEEGMELAQSTVKVTMVGPESQPQFLTGASGECRVSDFPTPGESTLFEWNQNTQHLEAVMRDPSTDLDTCTEGLTVHPEEMCSGSLVVFGQEVDFIFSVDADGRGCIEVNIEFNIDCFNTAEEFESLLSILQITGPAITKNDDGSWTIDSIPTEL